MHQSSPSEPALVYQATPGRRYVGALFGGLLALGGVLCTLALLDKWHTHDKADAFTLGFMGLCGLIAGAAMMATSLRYRLSLTPRSLVLRSAWKTESMQRSDIAGYRMLADRGTSTLILISHRGPAHGVAVHLAFKTDQPFQDWMEGIPDLNLADFNASARAVDTRLREQGFSGNADAAVYAANRRALWLLYASVGAFAWSVMAPQPMWLVTGFSALLPLLALELFRRQPELFALWEFKLNSAQTDLSMHLLLPGMALGMLALHKGARMPWTLCAAGALGLAVALSALFGTWRTGRRNFAMGTALLVPYAGMLLLVAFGRP